MQKLYTYETELKPKHNQEIIDYFNDYTVLFNKIIRSVWQYYNHQVDCNPLRIWKYLREKSNSYIVMVSRMTAGELPETWWNILEFIRIHIIFYGIPSP